MGQLVFAGHNLDFQNAKLTGACFDGAKLSWDNVKANKADWYEYDEDEDGPHPRLENADFRQADNVLLADFTGAEGLEPCFFEDEATKAMVIKQAKENAG